MLKDSAHIQETEAEWKNRKAKRAGKELVEPMYTLNDAEGVLEFLVPCNYDDKIELAPGIDVRFRMQDICLGQQALRCG